MYCIAPGSGWRWAVGLVPITVRDMRLETFLPGVGGMGRHQRQPRPPLRSTHHSRRTTRRGQHCNQGLGSERTADASAAETHVIPAIYVACWRLSSDDLERQTMGTGRGRSCLVHGITKTHVQ